MTKTLTVIILLLAQSVIAEERDSSRIVQELYETSLIHLDHWRKLNKDAEIKQVFIHADIYARPNSTKTSFYLYVNPQYEWSKQDYDFKNHYHSLTPSQATDIVKLVSSKLEKYCGIQ